MAPGPPPADTPRARPPRVAGVVLAVLASAGVVHALVVLVEAWRSGERWPAESRLVAWSWIERRVRGLEEVGLVVSSGTDPEWVEELRATLPNVVAPARLCEVERDVSVLVVEEGLTRAEVAQRARAAGFEHVVTRPKGRLALASRAELPRAEEPARLPPRGAPVGQVAFVLALLAPAAAALRRGARGVGLACLGAPLAWALAAAVTDLFDASAAWTWGAYAAAVLGWLHWTRAPSVAAAHAPPLSRGARAALGALALLALALAMHQCGRALDGMVDARSMYNLRGRLIVHDARLLAPFGQTQTWRPQHPDYPPLLSFAVAGAYRAIGAAAPAGPLGLQAAFWLGFGLLLFDCCRRRLGAWPAVAAVALVFVSPTTARVVSYQVCDAPLAFTLGAALLAWRAAHASGDGAPARRWASLAGLLLGVCALLKNEGLMLGAVFWLVALARAWRAGATRRAWLRAALAALPAYALLLAFKLQAPENDVVAHAAFGARLLERAPAIARAFALELLDPRAFASVFPLAFAALVYTWRRPRGGPDRELGALILLALAAFVAVYLVSPHDIHWHLDTSLRRVLLQLYPAALVLLCARLAALDAGARVSCAPSRRPGRRR